MTNEKITVIVAGTKRGDVTVRRIAKNAAEFGRIVEGIANPVNVPGLMERGIILVECSKGALKNLPVNENLLPFMYCGNVIFTMEFCGEAKDLTEFEVGVIFDWLEGLQ